MKRTASELDINYPSTPKKCRTTEQGDRFIPSRSAIDIDLANFNLTSKENEHPNFFSPAKENYNRSLAKSMSMNNTKVLAFKTKAPPPPETYENHLRVLYTQNKGSTSGSAASAAAASAKVRQIATAPERVLDAPGIRDDYYLNLLDWGANNVLAVALDNTVYLWNAASGDITELMQVNSPVDADAYVSSVSWTNDGSYLAVGTSTNEVQLWDVTKGKQMRTMDGHCSRVSSLAWNKHVLSSGGRDSMIVNHDVRIRDHIVSNFQGHEQEVCSLAWSHDGSQLASGGNDNLLHIWGMGSDAPRHTMTHHQAAIKALAWCPWQRHLLATGAGTSDRCIRFWNTDTGACLNSIDTGSQVCALKWSTSRKEIVSSHGFSRNQLTVWKYPTMTKLAELSGHTQRVLYLAQSPDGESIVSAAGDERLRFWKIWPKVDAARVASKRASSRVSSASKSGKAINIR